MIVIDSLEKCLYVNGIKGKLIYTSMLIAALSFSSCNKYQSAGDAKSENLSTINEQIDKKESEVKGLEEEVRELREDKKDRERR